MLNLATKYLEEQEMPKLEVLPDFHVLHVQNVHQEYQAVKEEAKRFLVSEKRKAKSEGKKWLKKLKDIVKSRVESEFSESQVAFTRVLEEAKRQAYLSAQAELGEIALAISEKVLKTQLSLAPESLLNFVTDSLAQCSSTSGTDPLGIELAPEHAHAMLNLLTTNLEIIANPSLELGKVRVILKSGKLEFCVFDELQQLKKSLSKVSE